MEEIVSTIVAVHAFVFLEWEAHKAGQEHHILQEGKKKSLTPRERKIVLMCFNYLIWSKALIISYEEDKNRR